MTACGVDLGELTAVVKQYLEQEYQSLQSDESADPQPTAGFQRVIQRAILHVQSERQGHGDRRQCAGRAVLRARKLRGLFPAAAGHEPPRCRQLHQPRHRQGRPQVENKPPEGADGTEAANEDKAGDKGKKETALDQFTVNLNEKAEDG